MATLFPSTNVRLLMSLPASYRKTYEVSLAEASNRDSARIPIEKFSGHGLLFAGSQDAMWQSDSAVQELSERNKNLESVIYPGRWPYLRQRYQSAVGSDVANNAWRDCRW